MIERPVADHVPWLDGLRGIAALWVFVSHVQILSGMRYVPLISWGGLAVDLFMMLSGFLMAHHYLLRRAREPWEEPSTWVHFWTRRFFRIAPLYYLLLIVALALGPWLGEQRGAIAAAWPTTATPAARYADQSFGNLLAHMSFVFGALPDYAFRTALPDWSIGLEMQFYLVFPLLMLAVARFGAFTVGTVTVAACVAMRWLWPGYFHQFEMPAFLPLKMYVFFIGMGIALSRIEDCHERLEIEAFRVHWNADDLGLVAAERPDRAHERRRLSDDHITGIEERAGDRIDGACSAVGEHECIGLDRASPLTRIHRGELGAQCLGAERTAISQRALIATREHALEGA